MLAPQVLRNAAGRSAPVLIAPVGTVKSTPLGAGDEVPTIRPSSSITSALVDVVP